MCKDSEFKKLQRRIYIQTAPVILIIIVTLLIIINSLGLIIGDFFYNEFCVLNTRFNVNRFNFLQTELENGKKNKHWQDVSIDSYLGYTLKGTYLPCPSPTNKTVIFLHGAAANRLMGLWYAPMYLNAGYNVLIYDSRACGESGGEAISWGYYEKYDLEQWVDWVKEHRPNDIIGVHGISMGAATALLHAELNESTKKVNFYIADSSYSNLELLLSEQINTLSNNHNPLWIKLLLKYSSLAAYMRAGFLFDQVTPITSVQKATTPILYLHGSEDLLVPPAMCTNLANATNGFHEKYIFPKEGHAMAIFNQKAEYKNIIYNFITTALLQ